MNTLKNLLSIQDLKQNEIYERFLEIAKVLMGNYVIRKGDKSYAVVEIEFYLYSPNHQDYITYPRKTESGRWFFHPSGVDLSFKSIDIECHIDKDQKVIYKLNNAPCFGGILIRGLYNLNNKHNEGKEEDRYIFGPQKCVDVLWNDLDAFDGDSQDYPVLKKAEETRPLNLFHCKRYINIVKDKQESKINDWINRLGLTVSDKEIENYRENLFDNSDTMRYRFFNLQNGEEPWNFSKIPSVARPKEAEIVKIE